MRSRRRNLATSQPRNLVIALILLASCATAPVRQPAAPPWSTVPAGVLEAFCNRLHDDAIALGGTLAIVKNTQPLANTTSMSYLAGAYFRKPDAAGAVDAMVASHGSMPIDARGGSCAWEPIVAIDASHRDVMVIELSSPLANPYARNEAGIFARVSLGGVEPSWYWIALVPRAGAWTVGRIQPLGVR